MTNDHCVPFLSDHWRLIIYTVKNLTYSNFKDLKQLYQSSVVSICNFRQN